MPNEPFWLPAEFTIQANRDEVAKTGEPHLVRSRDLLESACNRGRTFWSYAQADDLHLLACQILLGIARNHPFEQGNKRAALITALAFLEANDVRVSSDSDVSESLAALVLGVLNREMTDEHFVGFFRDVVTPPSPVQAVPS